MILKLKENISEAARQDIVELQGQIERFKGGEIDEERFKAFRLARGVYGQRQLGVQMFRLKIPSGKLTAEQLVRVAELSETFTNGNLHTTTRQNIQLHYVKLEDTPEMWAKLEEVGVTTREACGNTVRNITASATAGIDPEEPFDVAPYVEETFRYFLRNPICQEMGRKVKIAFSSSEKDSAFTYFHDFGFIPRLKNEQGKEVRGFKVVIGGGLGAQSFIAHTVYEFLPEEKIIPFMEAALRVFDRYGERERRYKARMKFLIDEKNGVGLKNFLQLVAEEEKAIANKTYWVNRDIIPVAAVPETLSFEGADPSDPEKYSRWLETNVFEQKQKGLYGVKIKLLLGNISSQNAIALADVVRKYAADDIRITVSQGFLLRHVSKSVLPNLFNELNHLGLAEPGAETLADVTACPGTDSCNLAVTNSTDISVVLENVINEEFAHLIKDSNIFIKISGCMNSCGQHMAANIGLHGSSIKNGALVVPAMQVVIGGGVDPQGKGFIADKVIKLPTKKIPEALRYLLSDYDNNAEEEESFNDYYQRQGKKYFYGLLKPLADVSRLEEADYIDWGHEEQFIPEIGKGECAGVSLDVVGTIIQDAVEKNDLAKTTLQSERFAESIYHSYNTFVVGAKALLLGKDIACNTQNRIIRDFNEHYVESGEVKLEGDFESVVLQINKNEPEGSFATAYYQEAKSFLDQVIKTRSRQVEGDSSLEEKLVIGNYYKA